MVDQLGGILDDCLRWVRAPSMDLAQAVFAPDHVIYDSIRLPFDLVPGPEGMMRWIGYYHEQFGDLAIEFPERITSGTGSAALWQATGVYRAAERQVQLSGIAMSQMQDGRIVATWNSWNVLDLVQQLGGEPRGFANF